MKHSDDDDGDDDEKEEARVASAQSVMGDILILAPHLPPHIYIYIIHTHTHNTRIHTVLERADKVLHIYNPSIIYTP